MLSCKGPGLPPQSTTLHEHRAKVPLKDRHRLQAVPWTEYHAKMNSLSKYAICTDQN